MNPSQICKSDHVFGHLRAMNTGLSWTLPLVMDMVELQNTCKKVEQKNA